MIHTVLYQIKSVVKIYNAINAEIPDEDYYSTQNTS